MANQTKITKDIPNKKIFVTREFNAPLENVWRAWTEKELLDAWWAPKPWKAVTKTMDFREGGHWQYAMVGPDGTSQSCRVNFLAIEPQQSFTVENGFCDEQGNMSKELPSMHWKNTFIEDGDTTRVEVAISFDTESELMKIVEMGFEQGFSMGLDNLEELLSK